MKTVLIPLCPLNYFFLKEGIQEEAMPALLIEAV